MALTTPRKVYRPFQYDQCYDYFLKQQQAHWLPTEISMSSDLQDFKINLTDSERSVISGVLKGFVQAEIFVADYWGLNVAKWFPHPEVAFMANSFAGFEAIHAISYAYLLDSLGMEKEFEAFLHDPSAKAKIDRLVEVRGKSLEEKALSLAVFSGFTEGVSLFSAFAILMSFSRYNKMKGLGQIISYSVRDESLHAQAGCYLFRTLVKENPHIWTDELKQKIYQASRDTVALEDAFIDMCFKYGEIEGLSVKDLKTFIRHRANTKLGELGLKQNWKNLDQDAIKRMEWFDMLSAGEVHTDFFSTRPSEYSKGTINWDEIF